MSHSVLAVAVILAALSMTLAVVSSVIAWRLAREMRRRSDARVTALRDEIGATVGDAVGDDIGGDTGHTVDEALDLMPVDAATQPPGVMFGSPPPDSRATSILALGILAAGAASIMVVLMTGRSHPPAGSTSAGPHSDAGAPLELSALDDEQQADRLVVRGVVKNPASGVEIRNLTAVVFLFDRNGAFLATGRTSIAPPTLRPGARSPFIVAVDKSGDVGRYRVSFRTEGGILPHVDLRHPVAALVK